MEAMLLSVIGMLNILALLRLLCIGNVLAIWTVGAQYRHFLIGLRAVDVDSHKTIRCLQLNRDILLVDIREAVRVHGMEILDLVGHFAGLSSL